MDSVIEIDDNPVIGITQPSNGGESKLKFSLMGRRRKQPAPSDSDHSVMRRNMEARLRVMFPRATGVTQQYEQLSKLSGVGAETIRKIMNEDQSPTLKNISAIARAIGKTLPELFTDDRPPRSPDHGLPDGLRDGIPRRT